MGKDRNQGNKVASAIKKVSDLTEKATDVVNNQISKRAVLSKTQMEDLEERKKNYFSQLQETDQDKYLSQVLAQVSINVTGNYLPQIKEVYYPIQLPDPESNKRVTSFDISKWVCDPKEHNIEKLSNVYQVLTDEDCAIALIFHRSQEECKVTMAIANHGADSSRGPLDKLEKRLRGAIFGNFPGAELYPEEMEDQSGIRQRALGVPDVLSCFLPPYSSEENEKNALIEKENRDTHCKCTVATVTNLATEKSEKFISQSIEKLLDGIVPQTNDENYSLILLATPCHNIEQRKAQLCQYYTALSPLASWQSNKGFNSSLTESAIANVSVNGGFSAGLTLTANYGRTFSKAEQIGESEGITQTVTNYEVKHTLDILEEQVKRLDQCAALGMWDFAAYVVSNDSVISKNVAHMYLSLTQGERSYVSQAAINVWEPGSNDEKTDGAYALPAVDVLMDCLCGLRHPKFALRSDLLNEEQGFCCYPTQATATTCLSSSELAHALNFPQKSVSGLPVLESTPFGREVQKFVFSGNDQTIDTEKFICIGNVYHMRKDEKKEILLSINDLSSHAFVTGSTGTGKSNAIYQLLHGLTDVSNHAIHFLVIEPAKGEYRKVFGGKSGVSVYGTNQKFTKLLQINPFSFPDNIHVLEHIDRLVEIFNACWPMYAAMPAVLKDAIEKIYERVGWNLRFSKCNPKRFPTFVDLIDTLPDVMNSSMYSADTKSDYSGALITRVRSLTNGINGHIFCSGRELSDQDLFDKNVIIDLSRVGSNETKSLMMGILVMKLQEYRLNNPDGMNKDLIHVTVLEEAHNLLRRTSVAQSQEGANLQGKSVEMLTNSIAEMRTYGEGFIIADQAPELLDEAVIRNTNTKIVLRLPDQKDRELVGTSMALNEDQIIELARLPKGVAAVYQNDWVEAVLCHFRKYEGENPLQYSPPSESTSALEKYFAFLFGISDCAELRQEEVDTIKDWIDSFRRKSSTAKILDAALHGKQLSKEEREVVAYNVFEGKNIATVLAAEKDENIGLENASKKIMSMTAVNNDILVEEIRRNVINAIFRITGEGSLQKRYRGLEESRRPMV